MNQKYNDECSVLNTELKNNSKLSAGAMAEKLKEIQL